MQGVKHRDETGVTVEKVLTSDNGATFSFDIKANEQDTLDKAAFEINAGNVDLASKSATTCPAPTVNVVEFKKLVTKKIDTREGQINKTTTEVETLYTNRCASVASCKCTNLACGGSTSGFSCVTGTYGSPKVCATCVGTQGDGPFAPPLQPPPTLHTAHAVPLRQTQIWPA